MNSETPKGAKMRPPINCHYVRRCGHCVAARGIPNLCFHASTGELVNLLCRIWVRETRSWYVVWIRCADTLILDDGMQIRLAFCGFVALRRDSFRCTAEGFARFVIGGCEQQSGVYSRVEGIVLRKSRDSDSSRVLRLLENVACRTFVLLLEVRSRSR